MDGRKTTETVIIRIPKVSSHRTNIFGVVERADLTIGMLTTPEGILRDVKVFNDKNGTIRIGYMNDQNCQIGMLCKGRLLDTEKNGIGSGFVLDGKILAANDTRIILKVVSNNGSITVEEGNDVSIYLGKTFNLTFDQDQLSIDGIIVQANDERCISKNTTPQCK